MITEWPKCRGLYYISSEMRCTQSFVVFYTEKLLSSCLYFFYRTKCIHLQYLHKAGMIKKKYSQKFCKRYLVSTLLYKRTMYKIQREKQPIKFLHMPLMAGIFSKCKPNQKKPIFNWGGGVKSQSLASYSHQIWRCAFINCERPGKMEFMWTIHSESSVKNLQKGKTANNSRQGHHSVTHFLQVVCGLLRSWMLKLRDCTGQTESNFLVQACFLCKSACDKATPR